jgi:hypothetical protein
MGLYNLDAVSGSTDYSKGGNRFPEVNGGYVLALVDLKFVAKMGKSQSPGYVFNCEVLESENPRVPVGRCYEFIIGLNGSQFDMLEGVKRLISFIGAFAGFEPNTPFKSSDYLTDDGKGKWAELANAGKLRDEGLMAVLTCKVKPTKAGGTFRQDTFLPYVPDETPDEVPF